MIELDVIIAARRRNWTLDQIGAAAGVTREAIRLRLAKYEQERGPIEIQSRNKKFSKKRFWRCACCDRLMISSVGAVNRHLKYGAAFCSFKCHAESKRRITDAMIQRAIDARWQGRPWYSVAHIIGFPVQTVQQRIWKYLYQVGMLDEETVESIWGRKGDGAPPVSWQWIERNTGLYLTQFGCEQRKTRRGYSAYGSRALNPNVVRGAEHAE